MVSKKKRVSSENMYTNHTTYENKQGQVKKETKKKKQKKHVSRPDFYKKRELVGAFFVIYYFLLHAFFTNYLLPPGIR